MTGYHLVKNKNLIKNSTSFNNATPENASDPEKISSSKYYDIEEMHNIVRVPVKPLSFVIDKTFSSFDKSGFLMSKQK